MENKESYGYRKIRKNIWQVEEDHGVYCTLIQGRELAVLVDTGYGCRNLRFFVESHIATPYLVINSHGHPDHMGGNHWFEEVYARKEEWDVIRHFEGGNQRTYRLKELKVGERISLGDIHVEIVSLSGHTKGSIGVLVEEEALLIAGDAFNETLWLFNYGALSMEELQQSLKKAWQMNFSSYLCGHSDQEYEKKKMRTHIRNIEELKVEEGTKEKILGFETYCSSYQDQDGKSEIVFTLDRLQSVKNFTEDTEQRERNHV